MMDIKFNIPEQQAEWKSFVDSHPDAYTLFDGDVWTVFYDLPKAQHEIVYEVSDLQIRLALIQAGLFDAVEAWVNASTDKAIHVWWDRALRFQRDNPMVLQAAQALGVSDDQLNQLWLLAATL